MSLEYICIPSIDDMIALGGTMPLVTSSHLTSATENRISSARCDLLTTP